jgi:uncharacterized iron-regulated membrane protein
MKEGFRQSMAWLHTWTGLVVGWVLFFIFVTGTAGYVNEEITRWMRPELPMPERVEVADRPAMLERSLTYLEREAPNANSWRITLPHESLSPRRELGWIIGWEDMPEKGERFGRNHDATLNVRTGDPIPEVKPRDTGGGNALYSMHYALHYIPYGVAINIVGICSMLMLLAILTGVITHKKIFKDFFTFRPGKGQRSWLDAHNVISVMALPFFLMITYSGLLFYAFNYMPAAATTLYGKDRGPLYDELYARDKGEYLAVSRPTAALAHVIGHAEALWPERGVASLILRRPKGEPAYIEVRRIQGSAVDFYGQESLRFAADDGRLLELQDKDHAVGKVNMTFFGLHEGHFADRWIRWLYLLASLLGCGMIGTGLVLWTIKRRNQHAKKGDGPSVFDTYGLRLVEVLNVGTLVGLPAAVAAYFWANRLLPLDMSHRADWEMHCLFLAWGWMFLYASVRPLKRAWMECAWITVAGYGLIPLLNALTTNRHLGVSLVQGDWVMAGFDLSMFGLAAIFTYGALKIRRRWLKAEAANRLSGKEAVA